MIINLAHINMFVAASVLLYFGASVTSWMHGNVNMAAVWFFYACANVGMVMVEYSARS